MTERKKDMKETTEKKEGITLEDYLEYWYYNNYLPTSTSSSTDAYYRWMIFSVIEPNLPAMGLPVEKTYAIFLNALLERVSIKSENTAASLHRFLPRSQIVEFAPTCQGFFSTLCSYLQKFLKHH